MAVRLLAYLTGWARRNQVDAKIDEELRFHVEREIETNVARG